MIFMRDLRLLLVLVPFIVLSAPAVSTAQNRDQVATSTSGMVVTAHPLATYAGQRILDAGGNAAMDGSGKHEARARIPRAAYVPFRNATPPPTTEPVRCPVGRPGSPA